MYRSENMISIFLDFSFEGVYIINLDRQITYWNKGAAKITGYSSDEVVGNLHCYDLVTHFSESGIDACSKCAILTHGPDGKPFVRKAHLHHKDGYQVPISMRGMPLKDTAGTIVGAMTMFIDNSLKESLSKEVLELKALAMVDQLTGIYNRRFGEISIQSYLSALRTDNMPLGILFMDIDNFKNVNDCYGHETGDLVLKMITSTIAQNLRPSDLLVRWGGEEIVAILRGNLNSKRLLYVANKLRVLVENSSTSTKQGVLAVTISIGATLANPTDTLPELIFRADQLMYVAKRKGKNQVSTG